MSTNAAEAPRDTDPSVGRIDARPILRRTHDNVWERTERLRSELYHRVEDVVHELGFEGLVLQSDPYVHPAWVKVAVWKPEREGALTARCEMTVTITAMPYHRYEAIYRVDWEKQGRRGTADHLYAFGHNESREMLRRLVVGDGLPIFSSGPLNRILKRVQLRTKWWKIWMPRNKVATLRRDLVRIGSGSLLAVGLAMLLLSLDGDPAGGSSSQVGYDPADTTVAMSATDTTTAAPSPAPVLASDSAAAPPATTSDTTASIAATGTAGSLAAGEDAVGFLDPSDPRTSDTRVPYEEWRYQGSAGEHVVVTMMSSEVDPQIIVGQVGESWQTLAGSPPATVTGEARVELTLPATGEYAIAAAARSTGATGRYTIRVDRTEATP